jgi:hypothetical protein
MPGLLSILLFPISPFLSFLFACTNLKERGNGVVFVLFYALFGYCHTFTDVRADSYRKFVSFRYHDPESFTEIFQQLLNGEKMDIYETALFSWLHNWTDSPNVMMMVVGFIAGFFVLKILRRVLSDYTMPYNTVVYIISAMIFILISPVHIGGIRYLTALAIFTYSALRFVIDKKNWWIIGILLSPFIHFSFIVLVVVALLVRVIRLDWTVLLWPTLLMCVVSMFIDTSAWSGTINEIGAFMGDNAITDRAELYADEDTEIHFSKSLTTQVMSVQKVVSSIYMLFMLLFIKRNSNKLSGDKYTQYILYLSLVFLLLGYTLTTFSIVGSRYLKFGLILFYMFILNLYRLNPHNITLKRLIFLLPIVNIADIAWTVYNCYCNVGIDIFYMPLPFLLL